MPTNIKAVPSFATAGTEKSSIEVRISYRIIQLFSEGLYSSPQKAIEELVSNAFDAGAEYVHILVAPDLVAENATIVVIDDGVGMDEASFRQHWLIGESNKRQTGYASPKGRKQIGKFGIGKLATYVLASRLTHITKAKGKYYSVSMDFTAVPVGTGGGVAAEEVVTLPLRELTEKEAKQLVYPWTTGDKPGYAALQLFGKGAKKSWTVAILSDLKDMARELHLGRLKWVLATGMPLRSDFNLYLNGDPVVSSKIKEKKIESWVIGKNLKQLPNPAPDNLEVTEDAKQDDKSPERFGLTHPTLGRVTGKSELYEDLLTKDDKAQRLGRSHGFFVYVRGRLVNAEDDYFGISSNKLRHGTFSRFRCEVHIDRLDEELRSSRESVRDTSLVATARNILEGIFNVARAKHAEFENEQDPSKRAARRVAESPDVLTRRPIYRLVLAAIEGRSSPETIRYPSNLDQEQRESFAQRLEELATAPEGLIREVAIVPLSQTQGIAIYDPENARLEINSLHPFVAYFSDEFENKKQNLPLELLAISEVLLEARLYDLHVPEETIRDVMQHRDESLRQLARSTGKRNALMIAQDLEDAATDQARLQEELVAAFYSMGFNAVPIGGVGNPDGIAEAHLAGGTGKGKAYRVTLEARARNKPGEKVTAKDMGLTHISKQRDGFQTPCEHAVLVAPEFPKGQKEAAMLTSDIQADLKKTGRTITLITVTDLARLVRLVPAKRIGLHKLRELFQTCTTPEQSKAWIDKAIAEKPSKTPYRDVLEAIAEEQKDVPDRPVNYSLVEARLRLGKKIWIKQEEIVEICLALSRIVPEYVYATATTIEINTRPDKVLEAINSTIREYPEEDRPVLPIYK